MPLERRMDSRFHVKQIDPVEDHVLHLVAHVTFNLEQSSTSFFFFNISHNINQARYLSECPTFWIFLVVFSEIQIKHFWQEGHLGEGVCFLLHVTPGCPCPGLLRSIPKLSWSLSDAIFNYHAATRCPRNS